MQQNAQKRTPVGAWSTGLIQRIGRLAKRLKASSAEFVSAAHCRVKSGTLSGGLTEIQQNDCCDGTAVAHSFASSFQLWFPGKQAKWT
jgi:hypothetical protein